MNFRMIINKRLKTIYYENKNLAAINLETRLSLVIIKFNDRQIN